ncbi:MAG: ArsB/NhaD family transporter [Fusobacteriaceae bacterium]
MNVKLIIGALIFFVTFYHIIKGKYPKCLVSLLGGGLMVIVRIIDEHEALRSIGNNLEILLLLTGLMMIVEIMAESGIFQWFAIKVSQIAKGEPIKILIFLSIVSAICSALLDNVTTVLLLVPVAILLARQLKLDPFPFVMMQIFASNIGGAATMIGDPPNLVIASAAKIGFNEFILNLGPIVAINMVLLLTGVTLYYKKELKVSNEVKAIIMELDSKRAIKNKKLMKQSLILFLVVMIGFLTNVMTHIGLAVISIVGSAILMLVTKQNPEHIFKKVEWETLFFFGGLFVLVDGIEVLGVMEYIGKIIIDLTQGDKIITTQLIVVVATFLTPILGAVPFTLSFLKIINQIIPTFQGDTQVFWWALSLGACFGGNMTLIGASANMVAASIAKKDGLDISFARFFKFGILVVVQCLVVSMLYLYLRY